MDIDLDFETDFRGQVIDYLIEKYKGHAARICSYGLYQVKNLVNDLAKVCGLPEPSAKEDARKEKKEHNDEVKKEIIAIVKQYINEKDEFEYDVAKHDPEVKRLNYEYDNIIKHFSKLYKKFRYFGTHAAGVAISGTNIVNYTALERRAKGAITTSYDLTDIERINAVKFDMLGLRTMSVLKELRKLCKSDGFDYEWVNDEKLFKEFGKGNTDGIFQFESKGGKNVLQKIHCDSINDVIAASALNRPGPLMSGMVDRFAEAKLLKSKNRASKNDNNMFAKYSSDTYGCFVYQEQIIKVCKNVGKMSWNSVDKIIKFMKHGEMSEAKYEEAKELSKEFVKGAVENGVDKSDAKEIFKSMLVYAFNKGHATGYGMISVEQMYHKVYNPMQFWYVTLKYADDKELRRLSGRAVKDGAIILLPHVNGTSRYSLTKYEGDVVIQEGLSSLKGIGAKAANEIERIRKEGGKFKNADDFFDRIEDSRRVINKGVIEVLKEKGALLFDKDVYLERVTKYNTTLYSQR